MTQNTEKLLAALRKYRNRLLRIVRQQTELLAEADEVLKKEKLAETRRSINNYNQKKYE